MPELTMRPAVRSLVLSVLVLLTAPGIGAAQEVERASSRTPAVGAAWLIDPTRSTMQFRVQHLISQVQGAFTRWSGTIVTEEHDWTHGTVNVVAEAGSFDIGWTDRIGARPIIGDSVAISIVVTAIRVR